MYPRLGYKSTPFISDVRRHVPDRYTPRRGGKHSVRYIIVVERQVNNGQARYSNSLQTDCSSEGHSSECVSMEDRNSPEEGADFDRRLISLPIPDSLSVVTVIGSLSTICTRYLSRYQTFAIQLQLTCSKGIVAVDSSVLISALPLSRSHFFVIVIAVLFSAHARK